MYLFLSLFLETVFWFSDRTWLFGNGGAHCWRVEAFPHGRHQLQRRGTAADEPCTVSAVFPHDSAHRAERVDISDFASYLF